MKNRIFLSATWEWLAMFNYEVDEVILKPHLPPHTAIDSFEGKVIVSVVGFLFNNTRVLGIPWPGFTHFEEVNLRYYIKHFDGKEWKRGVGFISEIVPNPVVSFLANTFYNEHYSTAQMRHSLIEKPEEVQVSYEWKKKGQEWNSMSVAAKAIAEDIPTGSEAEFIFEHYFGYNRLTSNTAIEYAVMHPRWQVHAVTASKLDCDVEQLYGKEFVPYIQGVKPRSVFLAKGSDVQVKMPVKIRK